MTRSEPESLLACAPREALLRAVHNPFSTRRVRPGALSFEMPPGKSLCDLLAQLERQGWRGAIVGPHGSGKSTLLAALVERLAAVGRPAWVISLRDDHRPLPRDIAGEAEHRGAKLVAVDGYQRLSTWRRWRLNRLCRRRGLGLLVTSHALVRLPLLLATAASAELAETLAARLLGGEWDEAYRERLRRSHRARAGDLREVFFDMYDLYESRRRDNARGDGASLRRDD